MNEIQIRLSADISLLTSELAKAKKAIKGLQDVEEGNKDAFKPQIGAINALTAKINALKVAKNNAFDEKDIADFNKQLEEAGTELTRLNALGRSVTANLGSSFQRAGSAIGGTNAVALEFNRIIQDAPFGLIGIGNNLQQLAGNFSQLKTQSGSTGKAIGLAFTSILSPVNLGLLAISALTAGFTAYQMGAFDSAKETDFLAEALKRMGAEAETASEKLAAIQFSREKINQEIDTILGLDSSFNLIGASAEQMTEIMNRAFAKLDRTQLDALADQIEGIANDQLRKIGNELGLTREEALKFIQGLKGNTDAFEALAPKIRDAVSAYRQYDSQAKSLNQQLGFYEENTKKSTKATNDSNRAVKELKQEISSFSTDPLVDAYFKAIQVGAEFRRSLEEAASGLTGKEGDDPMTAIQNQIAASLNQSGPPVKEFADEYKVESDRLTETNRAIIDSFGALGTAIAANLNISNDAVKGFVSTVLSNAPKLIQAIIAQAQASNRAADIANQGNIKQATGNAIVTATSAAKGLGPIGLAALPIFIGGALALISSAFGKSSGGGGSASVGSASAGAPPQIFTNSQIPSIPGSPAPSPSGNIDFDRGQGRLTTTVSGGDIVFVYEREKERQQGGG